MLSDVFTKSNLNTKGMHSGKGIQIIKYERYVNVFMLTIVHRFQSSIMSSRAGTSSSLEVIITSLKSEMSLRSNESLVDPMSLGMMQEYNPCMDMGKDIGDVVVNVHRYTEVYLELDLWSNDHHLG